MEKFMAGCFLLVLSVPCSLYNAFMFTFMWRWFIIPLGAPTIGTIHAWGLFLCFSFLTSSFTRDKHDKDDPIRNAVIILVISMLTSTFATGMGYILHQVM